MNIIVTGANGQLGSEIKAISADYNHTFTFCDLEEMDLSSPDSIKNYLNSQSFDIIISCGAYTNVDGAEGNKELAHKINAEAPGIIAQICNQAGARMIHISTDYVFNGQHFRPILEDDEPDPVSVYGSTKLEGEQNIFKHLDNVHIIRTSWVYSEFGKNFVKTMLKLGAERDELNVISDQIGTPTYAADLAECIMHIIENPGQSGIYNYSNDGVCSWYDFATAIMKLNGLNCQVNSTDTSGFPTKAIRPHYSVLDKSKIRNNFELTIPHWQESLERCLKRLNG